LNNPKDVGLSPYCWFSLKSLNKKKQNLEIKYKKNVSNINYLNWISRKGLDNKGFGCEIELLKVTKDKIKNVKKLLWVK